MTVEELIEQLKKYDLNLPVVIEFIDQDEGHTIVSEIKLSLKPPLSFYDPNLNETLEYPSRVVLD